MRKKARSGKEDGKGSDMTKSIPKGVNQEKAK